MSDTRNAVRLTFRLNLDNQTHYKIYEVLHNLDPVIYKSMNQFMIDALDDKINRHDITPVSDPGGDEGSKPVRKSDLPEIEAGIEDRVTRKVETWVFEMMSKALWGGRPIEPVPIQLTEEKEDTVSEDTLDDVLGDLAAEWADNS